MQVDTGTGIFWAMGWLFTIGYADLSFWKGVLGLVVWPYTLALALKQSVIP